MIFKSINLNMSKLIFVFIMEERKKYRCLKCKFIFYMASNRNLRCPNCGSESELIEEVKSGDEAQKIVENSESWN